MKKQYEDQTHGENINDTERVKRVTTLAKLIEEMNDLEKQAKDPTKIIENKQIMGK